ncbi:MAG: guanylate kinase, partial [Bacteroidota bacterium]|nr:guanylate kinase [Bacteroidota bacterium]
MKATALIVSAPSGTGKTTILHKLFEVFPNMFSFSVSATTRQKRENEKHGEHYYFLSQEEFDNKIKNSEFLEYENVYEGLSYGTLKSEIQRINSLEKIAVFDVDVKGGVNIKQQLKDRAVSVFFMPPSIEVLKQRLLHRNTETEESLNKRLQRAELEIKYAN